ncbi:hypothetical protein ACEWY4_003562 [Coilia grayii]|uniref:ZP domain-containing protein n=1 Tax=Coilia grayii TaxID=363190 RepID=A0ABD1KRK5_9TELE
MCLFREEYTELCSIITNSSGPFQQCHLHVDPQAYFTSCVYDLCAYTPANGMLCSAVEAYETACSLLGSKHQNGGLHYIASWTALRMSGVARKMECTAASAMRIMSDLTLSPLTLWSSVLAAREPCLCLAASCLRQGSQHTPSTSMTPAATAHSKMEEWSSFSTMTTTCGMSLRSNSTHFIYENSIHGDANSGSGPISRERQINLHFSCVYPLTLTLSMNVEINPLESIVTKKLPGGEGTYRVRMIPYEDAGFSHAHSGGVDVQVNQQIYVEVRVDGVESSQIATVIDSCWATPVNQPDYHIR